LCAGSFLSGQQIIPVSSKTGEGLPQLRNALSCLAQKTVRQVMWQRPARRQACAAAL